MAVSVLVDGVPSTRLVAGVSPLAELGACLHVLAEPEHHPRALGWASTRRDRLGPDLLRRVDALAPLWGAYRCRLLLPLSRRLARTLEEELAELAALDLSAFEEFIGFVVRGGYADASPAAGRIPSAARSELAARLLASPSRLRGDLLDLLAELDERFFAAEWERVRDTLRQAAADLVRKVQRDGPAMALASLSATAVLHEGPLRVVFDKFHHGVVRLQERTCLMIPSLYGWPHLLIKHEPGWPVIVQYPVRGFPGSPEVPLELLRRRLRALDEPIRLRLCRAIAREPLTTTELARRHGLTGPQASRHLRQLRLAQLVTVTREGRFVYYHLDLDVMRGLGDDLMAAIFR
jgi:DNA-binding transcriptional ArsR family regulator